MSETTLEEARRCPWCTEPGVHKSTTHPRGPGVLRGTKVETYECKNTRCPNWDDDSREGGVWVIQINPDGSVPPKGTISTQAKQWDINRETTEDERQRARDQMQRLLELEQKPGGEVR